MVEQDRFVDFEDWKQPIFFVGAVRLALGFAVVTWPHGRRQLQMYAGNIYERDGIPRDRLDVNLSNTMQDFRERHYRGEWLIRESKRNHRKKARRIAAVEFIKPSLYTYGAGEWRTGFIDPPQP